MHDDDPDDEDWSDDDSGDADTIPCPACDADVFDDADQCPRCGHWITDTERRAHAAASGPSRFVRFVAIVMIVILVATLLLAGTMF